MNLNFELFDFIEKSPSAFHAVQTVTDILMENGYTELFLGEKNELSQGGKYFVRKNSSSIIAFRYTENAQGFMISSSHSDSPAFKLKGSSRSGTYTRLDVEKYGGMMYYTWLDRPLSLAGRVYVKSNGGIACRLVNFDRTLAVIPSVAIHLNHTVNDGYKFNPAKDMLPLLSSGEASVAALIAKELSVSEEDILSYDLFVYNRDKGQITGADGDMLLCPRIDDLASVYASLKAFLAAESNSSVPVLAVFDNEEVGSETKQGAASSFFFDVLSEIGGEKTLKMFSSSFMISADNAHAKHPNHPELSDSSEAPVLNGGVVVKKNASQKYTTDAYSSAVLKELAAKCGITLQQYSNRADLAGGTTLGSVSNTKVPVPTADIGLPQLAMHSANETMGASDLSDMVKLLTLFYSSYIENKDGISYIR